MPITEISKYEIVDIALDMFLGNGIQTVTMKQLTEPTGVSTKTIYKMFASKSMLLKTCLMTHYARFFAELSQIASGADNEMESFLKIIDRVVELEFEINPRFYRDLNKFYPELQSEAIDSQSDLLMNWINMIDRGKENGLFLTEVDKDVFWITLQQLYASFTRENTYDHLNLSASKLIKNTVLVYLRGICTLRGLQELQTYLESQTLKIL